MDNERNWGLIIPKGTQIVTLIEVKVLNFDRFQPRGTVGVIKSQPTDSKHAYLVEFPDGSISQPFKRPEFAIRKHYQTNQALASLKDRNLYDYVIYRCVVGSRAFGLDDENSDTRFGGAFSCRLRKRIGHWMAFPNKLKTKKMKSVIGSCKSF